MDSEGMLHGLQETRRLLKLGRRLIGTHPLPEPAQLTVLQGERVFLSEVWPSQGPGDYLEAERAIQASVDAGLFLPAGKADLRLLRLRLNCRRAACLLRAGKCLRRWAEGSRRRGQEGGACLRVDRLIEGSWSTAEVAFNERPSISALARRL